MILFSDILAVHQFSIDKYGGSNGVRDLGSLESAIARPFQTFGGDDLYPSIFDKAAALGESLIVNHPFVDGNKRTGFIAMIALLREEEYYLTVTENDAYEFTIQISTGAARFDAIVQCLKNNTAAH